MQRHASVVIFGGTSEGRELAEYAEAHHIPVLVSVVSGYGESLLRESDLVQVHTGALDEAAMRQFLREAAPKLVLDATHPYARVIGKIDILDLNDAQSSKDDAKQKHIQELYYYWRYFYNIRSITLYDFLNNRTLDADFEEIVK